MHKPGYKETNIMKKKKSKKKIIINIYCDSDNCSDISRTVL